MDIYNVCYRMCTQKSPHNFSQDLYKKHGESLQQYLVNTVKPALEAKQDYYLLKELEKRWSNHTLMNKWMYRVR